MQFEENQNEYVFETDFKGIEREKKSYRKGLFVGALGTIFLAIIIIAILMAVFNSRVAGEFLTVGQRHKLGQLNALLDEYYYEDISDKDKVEGIYKGLYASAGDEYTEYYTPKEYEKLNAELTGDYAGIGATLQKDPESGEYKLIKIYKDSAAEEAGIKEGDVIVSVDGKKTSEDDGNMDDFVANNIRGKAGTVRLIVIRRGDEEKTVKVTLKRVIVPSVSYKMLDGKVGYIEISQFSTGTKDDFEKAVKDLQSQGMESVIYDLRNNGGGMVDSVTAILDDILPKGKVVYTKDKNGKEEDYYSDDEKQLKIPTVVLVNGGTASSSEIFTGAIRDFKWGTIIGENTFGKGIVQITLPLSDGSAIKVTNAKYYTPNGECIHKKGIKPDIELKYQFLGNENDEYDYTLDNQIQKALEVLKK